MKNNKSIPALTNSSIIGGVFTSTIKGGNTNNISNPKKSEYTGLCTINAFAPLENETEICSDDPAKP